VTTNVSAGLRYFVQVLGGIALMLTISVKLTLMIILLIPLLVLMSIFWAKRLRVLSKAIQTEIGSAAIIAEEAISGARTVKMFSAEQSEIARYNEVIQRTVGLGRERTKIAATFSSSMVFLIHSSIAVMFFYGTTLVLESALTVGDLSAFLMYCVIVAASFGFLAGVWDEFLQAVGAGERIFEIIDRQPQITAPAEPKLPASWDAQVPGPVVEFRNVYFEYPSRVGSPVLQGVSFSINAGETVALVGPSGSGKSTIASLILRLYDVSFSDVSFSDVNFSEVNSGEVYFAGENVKAYRPEDLRRDISVVSQEPQVFSVSILENIRFGKPTATEAEILQAARLANVHTFAERLPEGYQTLVGNRGTQLSGGERQRLTIARALLKDPRFLILDEATSSLDSENEHLIQQALTHLVHGRTTLVIAHRLSTIHHANQVLVVRHGRIEQRGTHESLFAQPGLYKSLVEHQLL